MSRLAHPPALAEDGISEQHHTIRQLIGSLGASDELEHFGQQLVRLEQVLESHFKLEESPEGFEQILGSRGYEASNRMDRLVKQHPTILAALRELEDQVQDVLGRTGRLIRMIKQHESAETELLTDVLYHDIGGGD
jgi:hypothetical protein